MQFYSPHNEAMRRYETALGEAKASDNDARRRKWQEKEDELVEGGAEAIAKYKAHLDEKWKEASCLVEYDGLSIGYSILRKAEARIEGANQE